MQTPALYPDSEILAEIEPPAITPPGSAIRGVDFVVVALFALIAIVLFVDRYRGVTPFVFLDGDTANIATFAAALDHPELFAGTKRWIILSTSSSTARFKFRFCAGSSVGSETTELRLSCFCRSTFSYNY